jgi:hypothetical protein
MLAKSNERGFRWELSGFKFHGESSEDVHGYGLDAIAAEALWKKSEELIGKLF